MRGGKEATGNTDASLDRETESDGGRGCATSTAYPRSANMRPRMKSASSRIQCSYVSAFRIRQTRAATAGIRMRRGSWPCSARVKRNTRRASTFVGKLLRAREATPGCSSDSRPRSTRPSEASTTFPDCLRPTRAVNLGWLQTSHARRVTHAAWRAPRGCRLQTGGPSSASRWCNPSHANARKWPGTGEARTAGAAHPAPNAAPQRPTNLSVEGEISACTPKARTSCRRSWRRACPAAPPSRKRGAAAAAAAAAAAEFW